MADDTASVVLEEAYSIRGFPKVIIIAPNGSIIDNVTAPRIEGIREKVKELSL